ncbi:MAG TPA: CapA family protein [Actinomycetales bacterium]|nr:CapA family protein [Actinomycetales bacterium]
MGRHAKNTGPNYALRRSVAAVGVVAVAAGGLALSMNAFGGEPTAGPGDGPTEVPPSPETSPIPSPEPVPEPTPEPTPEPEPDPVVFTLVMAGDVLPHATVNRNASQGDGTYDYAPMMEHVRPWIENADIALCSLEVPLAPPGTEVSAYPVFGAPEELISSLLEVGWQGCATATNHSLDRRVAGLEYTLQIMDEMGMGHTGTGRTPEETVSPQFYEVEKDGVELTIAHLSATTFHNDYTDPAQYADSLHALEAGRIDQLAKQAKADGADIVVFTPHWGQEYWKSPDGLQEDISTTLARGGNVDVVLGGHPHVPQAIELLDGGPDGEGMYVAYSMGNFLSNQDEKCCNIATATGLLVRTEITVEPGGGARVSGISWSGATVDTEGRQELFPIQALVDGQVWESNTLAPSRVQARYEDLLAQMGTELYDPAPLEPTSAVVRVVPRG